MMSTAKISHIDRFEDLLDKNHKIIIRKGTFVENFFDSSEAGIISKIRGAGKFVAILPKRSFSDKLEPRIWNEGDPFYPDDMRTLVEDVLYR